MQMFCAVVVRAAVRKGQVVCVCASKGQVGKKWATSDFWKWATSCHKVRCTLVLHLDTRSQVAVSRAARHQVDVCRAKGRGPLSLARALSERALASESGPRPLKGL